MLKSASRSVLAATFLTSIIWAPAAHSSAQAAQAEQSPPARAATAATSAGCSSAPLRRAQLTKHAAVNQATSTAKTPTSPASGGDAEKHTVAVEGAGIATKTSITSDSLQSSNSQNTYDAIKNVPGVAPADARGGSVADSLQIRGIKLSSTTSYRLDGGLPIVNNINLPVEDKCRIEALKGAGALEFGIASPAGIINYVLKRAVDVPITSITLSGSGAGQALGAIDIGRRFGRKNQFGIRTNFADGEIGSFVQGAGGTRYLRSLAADWNPSEQARVQVDVEQFGVDVVEQSALLELKPVNGVIPIPRIPDPTKLLSGPWARSLGVGENFFVRGEYGFQNGVTLIAETGRSSGNRPERNLSQIGNYDVTTGLGKETVTLVRDQNTLNESSNFQLKHQFAMTSLANEVTVGVNRNARDFNNPQNQTVTYAQNIYNPVVLAAPRPATEGLQQPNDSHDTDYYISDTVSFFDRLRVIGGVRQISYESDALIKSGKTNRSISSTLAPAGGVVYDFTRDFSLYASYVASLDETGQAPVNAQNAFQVLPPARATQKEIGIRSSHSRATSATLGYFWINKGNATIDPVTNIYALNGTITYQGLESTASVKLTPRLTLNAGGQLMRAIQNAGDDPSINNKVPENTPHVSDNIGLVYRPKAVDGLVLSGGMLFIGQRQINPQNQGTIPGITTDTAGATYGTRIDGHRSSFNLNCTNLLNKRYYSSAVNGALGVGTPRMVTFSFRLDDLSL